MGQGCLSTPRSSAWGALSTTSGTEVTLCKQRTRAAKLNTQQTGIGSKLKASSSSKLVLSFSEDVESDRTQTLFHFIVAQSSLESIIMLVWLYQSTVEMLTCCDVERINLLMIEVMRINLTCGYQPHLKSTLYVL